MAERRQRRLSRPLSRHHCRDRAWRSCSSLSFITGWSCSCHLLRFPSNRLGCGGFPSNRRGRGRWCGDRRGGVVHSSTPGRRPGRRGAARARDPAGWVRRLGPVASSSIAIGQHLPAGSSVGRTSFGALPRETEHVSAHRSVRSSSPFLRVELELRVDQSFPLGPKAVSCRCSHRTAAMACLSGQAADSTPSCAVGYIAHAREAAPARGFKSAQIRSFLWRSRWPAAHPEVLHRPLERCLARAEHASHGYTARGTVGAPANGVGDLPDLPLGEPAGFN